MTTDAAIVVRFAPGVDQARMEALLAVHGLEIHSSVTFVRNSYRVRAKDPTAPIDAGAVSVELEREGEVQFAEPTFVESSRNGG